MFIYGNAIAIAASLKKNEGKIMTTLNLLPEMLVDCQLKKFTSHSLVWASSDLMVIQDPALTEDEQHNYLKSTYSLGIPDSPCFETIDFHSEKTLYGKAERYGGYGIARNGGGVRCANIGQVQLKGIGANCLVGKDVLEGYCSGTLNIIDGVMEIIFSQLLNHVFPIGAVKTLGLIATAPNLASYKNQGTEKFSKGVTCWGSILLREPCVRPAHFLPAMFYKIATPYKGKLASDFIRTRRVNIAVKNTFNDDKKFLAIIGRFIQSCANQFAFAKIARFSHGAVTASNLALDGRWLDMPIASFLPGNKNFRLSANQLPFFSEHQIVDPTLIELIYNYCKYNNIQINSDLLLSLYHKCYSQYFHKHCHWLLGIPAEFWPKAGQMPLADECRHLLQSLILNDDTLVWSSPIDEDKQDVVINFIKHIHSSGYDLNAPQADAIVSIIHAIYLAHRTSITSELSFKVGCAIRSLRRAYFSSFFYNGRLRILLESMIDTTDTSIFTNLINCCDQIAQWVFNDDGEHIYLFKSPKITIWWSASQSRFFGKDYNAQHYTIDEITDFLQATDSNKFVIAEYNFLPSLIAITQVVHALITYNKIETTLV